MRISKFVLRAFFSKAQLSLEMIVLLSILLAGFAVVFLSASQTLSTSRAKIYHDQARDTVDSLALVSEQLYYQGVGAKKTIFVVIPDNVLSTGVSNQSFSIDLSVRDSKTQSVYAYVDFNVSGSIPSTSGTHQVILEVLESGVSIS